MTRDEKTMRSIAVGITYVAAIVRYGLPVKLGPIFAQANLAIDQLKLSELWFLDDEEPTS